MKHKKLFAAFVATTTFAALSILALAQAPKGQPQITSPKCRLIAKSPSGFSREYKALFGAQPQIHHPASR